MHRRAIRCSILHALAALGAGSLLTSAANAATTYSARILGTLSTDGTGTSYAAGINDGGVVVGGASSATGIVVFRWRQSTGMSDHGMLVPPNTSYGLSINSAEALCGFGLTQSSGFAGPFRENPAGPIQPLPRFAGAGDGYAYAIAENGVSVGWSNGGVGCGSPTCFSNPGHAVVWDSAGVMTPLPDLGGYFSVGTDISPDGAKICGYASSAGQTRAFRLVAGVATPLPPLPGYVDSDAWGINDAGQVVGTSMIGENRRATLWNATAPIDLGAPPGSTGSLATRVNASGKIVGYALLPGSTYRAITFAPFTPPADLNDALQTPSSYTLLYCNDVNASGQIVGQADSAGTVRGFVLTPVGTTAVGPAPMRDGLALDAPSPNPTRAAASLRFTMATPGRARLDVVDPGGRVVARLADGWRPAGEHLVEWDGRDVRGEAVCPGVFFVRVASGDRVATRKLVVSR